MQAMPVQSGARPVKRMRLTGRLAHLLASRAAPGQTVALGVEVPDGQGTQTALYRIVAVERRTTGRGEAGAVVLEEQE